MHQVEVYGADHSPWVQAVLLGLHDAGIPHTLTSRPPLETFLKSGVTMPAASIDGGPWQLESTEILNDVGFVAVSADQLRLVRGAWQGVLHRADSAALFWGGFSLAADRNSAAVVRLVNNFVRSFVTLYFFLLIRSAVRFAKPEDPDNFGDQFVPFEEMLAASGAPYLSGQDPNTLDFLLFGIIQCHTSIYVPPVAALQSDPRLGRLRSWVGTMQERFKDYDRLYSGAYFAPYSPRPNWASASERVTFWLGAISMLVLFPVTVPLVAFLAIRNRRRAR